MNAITMAMHNAGVQLPSVIKRIWLWVNDHPGKTAQEIAVALGEPQKRVASRLSEMKARQMVSFTRDRSLRQGRGIKTVHRYTVTQRHFELLPMPCKVKPTTITETTPVSMGLSLCRPSVDTPPPVAPNMPALVVTPPKSIVLDDLTVREARALYEQLHKMFGGKS